MHVTTQNPKNMKQKLTELQGEVNNSTIFGDFSTPLSVMDSQEEDQQGNKSHEQYYKQNYKSTGPNTYL